MIIIIIIVVLLWIYSNKTTPWHCVMLKRRDNRFCDWIHRIHVCLCICVRSYSYTCVHNTWRLSPIVLMIHFKTQCYKTFLCEVGIKLYYNKYSNRFSTKYYLNKLKGLISFYLDTYILIYQHFHLIYWMFVLSMNKFLDRKY